MLGGYVSTFIFLQN